MILHVGRRHHRSRPDGHLGLTMKPKNHDFQWDIYILAGLVKCTLSLVLFTTLPLDAANGCVGLWRAAVCDSIAMISHSCGARGPIQR